MREIKKTIGLRIKLELVHSMEKCGILFAFLSVLVNRVSSVELSVELSVVFMSVVFNMTLNSTIFNTDI